MLKVIFTLDYEIHGNGDGCPHALMLEPTSRLMELFERYGARLTIMADVAEILKFREYQEHYNRDDYHYEAVAAQLREAVQRGHDVQLHLHSSYFNAQFKEGRWEQDWSEYNFAGLPLERLNQMVQTGKRYLEDLLRPVNPEYECIAFRAGNWSVSPSRNVVRALVSNNIAIDTSVFKYGRREGLVSFDYTNAHSNLLPWRADEEDICRANEKGELVEMPIYCERRWIGAFLTRNRICRAMVSRAHRVVLVPTNIAAEKQHVSRSRRLLDKGIKLMQRQAWKADFNQCTGRQLIGALRRASATHDHAGQEIGFVLIGHSKLFNASNQRSLEPFLEYVANNRAECEFGLFSLAQAERVKCVSCGSAA